LRSAVDDIREQRAFDHECGHETRGDQSDDLGRAPANPAAFMSSRTLSRRGAIEPSPDRSTVRKLSVPHVLRAERATRVSGRIRKPGVRNEP
jgi:hypothetical protein